MLKKAKIAYRDAIIECLSYLRDDLEDRDNRMIVNGCIAMLEKIDYDEEKDD